MKILYLGNAQGFFNANKFYLIPQRLINGFTRLGHTVYVFNDRDYARYSNVLRSQGLGKKKLNTAILNVCRDYEPDLIVLGHCKNVTNDTFYEIRKNQPNVKIIYRNVDPLNCSKNIGDIKQRLGVADAIFITTAGEALKQFSNKYGKVYFMPNPVDVALDNQRVFLNKEANIDLIFLASALNHQDDHRHITAQFIVENKEGLNIHIGGAGINNNKIYGAQYMNIIGRSKMGLCINKTSKFYLYASDRMSQYMAAGILSFIPEGPNFEDILGKNSFISYSSDEELLDKVKYYAKNSDERVAIAQDGYEKIHDLFQVEKVCQYMIERAFKLPLSHSYQWPIKDY